MSNSTDTLHARLHDALAAGRAVSYRGHRVMSIQESPTSLILHLEFACCILPEPRVDDFTVTNNHETP